MIDLRIQNRSLDLDPNTSISMEVNNPVFAGEILPGSFSMPFTIPASANNGKILGFPEIKNLATLPKLRYEAELIIEGIPVLTGELILRGFGSGKYKLNFQSDVSLVNQHFSGINLRQLDHQTTSIVDFDNTYFAGTNVTGYKKLVIQCNNEDTPDVVSISVNGETFERDRTEPGSANWAHSLGSEIGNAPLGVNCTITVDEAQTTFTFQTKEKGIDQALEIDMADDAENPVYEIVSNWTEDYQPIVEDALKDFQQNDLSNADFVFPMYANDKFYDGKEGDYTRVFNICFDGEFVFDGKNAFIPMFSLDYIFRKIFEVTGVTIEGDFIDDPDLKKLILFNNHSLDYFEATFGGIETRMYYDRIEPWKHLPDMSINEFLIELGKLFSLGFNFDSDNKKLELYFKKDIITSEEFIDVTNKTNPRYQLDFSKSEGYTIAYKWNDKDELYGSQAGLFATESGLMDPIVIGEGKNPIEFKMHTVFKKHMWYDVSHWIKVPKALQPGTWAGKEPGSDPRLLFFYGLCPDGENHLYPYASCDNKDCNDNVVGEYSLELLNTTGFPWLLYQKFHQDWIEFLMIDQPITMEGYWSIIDLLNYQFKSKYRIDQIRYLVPKISYTVSTRRGLGPVTLEMLKAE